MRRHIAVKSFKRLFILALCLCMLFGTCEAQAETFYARQIDRCREFVNLRERPDSNSRSLAQVYIGEVVMAAPFNDAFSYCCYNGQFGYIRSEYLNSDIRPWSDGINMSHQPLLNGVRAIIAITEIVFSILLIIRTVDSLYVHMMVVGIALVVEAVTLFIEFLIHRYQR